MSPFAEALHQTVMAYNVEELRAELTKLSERVRRLESRYEE